MQELVPYRRAGLESHLEVLRSIAEEAWLEGETSTACAECFAPTGTAYGRCSCIVPVIWPIDQVIAKLDIELKVSTR